MLCCCIREAGGVAVERNRTTRESNERNFFILGKVENDRENESRDSTAPRATDRILTIFFSFYRFYSCRLYVLPSSFTVYKVVAL